MEVAKPGKRMTDRPLEKPIQPDPALEPEHARENGVSEAIADGSVECHLQVLAVTFAGNPGEQQSDQA